MLAEILWWLPWIALAVCLVGGVMAILRQHRHEYTNRLTVSGYGYTEYEVWFCKSCPQVFGRQTKAQR